MSAGARPRPPFAIPAKGWKDIAMRLYASIDDNRLLAVAAGVTFYAILALFPAIAAFVSVYALFSDPTSINDQLAAMSGILPGGAIDIIGEQVKRLAASPNKSLSLALVTSLAISLWSANAGMKAVFDALNVAYGEKEKRSFIALNLRSLAFTLSAIVLLVVMVASVVVVPVVLNFIGFASVVAWIVAIARWPVMVVLITLALSVLYRYGPSRTPAQWRWIGWGQRARGSVVAHRLVGLLDLRQQVRQLQRDLWLARRRHRFHDLDLDLLHRDPHRCRSQRADRAPDRDRYNGRRSQADGHARRGDGRQRRSGRRLTPLPRCRPGSGGVSLRITMAPMRRGEDL